MTSAAQVPVEVVDLLVRDARLLVVDDGREILGGWVSVTGGRVTGVGSAGTEPEALTTVSASGRLATPAWTTVVAGKLLVDRGEPVLPGLADALRTHGGIARRMQRI